MERRSGKPPMWAIALLILLLAVVFYFSSVPRGSFDAFSKDQTSLVQAQAVKVDANSDNVIRALERIEYIQRQRYQDWVETKGFKPVFNSEAFPSCLFDNPAYKETFQIRLVTDAFVIITFSDNNWFYIHQDLTWECKERSPTNLVACQSWCIPVAESPPTLLENSTESL